MYWPLVYQSTLCDVNYSTPLSVGVMEDLQLHFDDLVDGDGDTCVYDHGMPMLIVEVPYVRQADSVIVHVYGAFTKPHSTTMIYALNAAGSLVYCEARPAHASECFYYCKCVDGCIKVLLHARQQDMIICEVEVL